MAIMVATAVIPMAETSADETDFDQDLGQFYSYTVQFIFNGSQAETISWDFGDASALSTEWNPRHIFPATGTYYVTQTLTNSYNGGSTTVSVYKVQIMGFPIISFESNGGSSVSAIQQTAYNTTATEPSEPTRTGYTFAGWYTDAALTAEMDWTSSIVVSMTLYADWQTVTEGYYTITYNTNGGSASAPIQSPVAEGDSFTVASYSGIKTGYTFGGWTNGSMTFVAGSSWTRSDDITLTAIWIAIEEPEPVYYTVDFDLGLIDIPMPEAQTIISGGHVTDPNVTLEGYDLVWIADGEVYDFSSAVTSDLTLCLSATELEDNENDNSTTIVMIIIAVVIVILALMGLFLIK